MFGKKSLGTIADQKKGGRRPRGQLKDQGKPSALGKQGN